MKKNVMMRLASVLLVCVLLSTSVISGTFAKYVTKGDATATARVAKWGVAINSTADTMFATSYTKDSSTSFANTVEATEKVVAPGTKNDDAITFGITGTPEVAVRIQLAIADDFEDVFLKAGTYTNYTTADDADEFVLANDYYPVVYTLKVPGNDPVIGNLAEIKEFLSTYYVDFAPNANLADEFSDDVYSLSWAWAFDGEQELNGITFDKDTVDCADTVLGNVAAGKATAEEVAKANFNIDFDITITATQID